jgi:hypothetical protein
MNVSFLENGAVQTNKNISFRSFQFSFVTLSGFSCLMAFGSVAPAPQVIPNGAVFQA